MSGEVLRLRMLDEELGEGAAGVGLYRRQHKQSGLGRGWLVKLRANRRLQRAGDGLARQ